MSDNVAHALAGAGGGIISMALTYPLITISSRLQVQRSSSKSDGSAATTSPSAAQYRSAMDALHKIIASEGISGLFAGLESALVGNAVTNGVYYYFFEAVKKIFETRAFKAGGVRRGMTTIESMVAGAIAGAAVVFITNPLWVVNMRMTTKKNSADDSSAESEKQKAPATTWETAKRIYKEEGIGAFWNGTLPALILVINPIIQYTAFEQMRPRWQHAKSVLLSSPSQLGNIDFFLLGAISKLIATTITYPYIVVKSRMQLRQSKDAKLRYNSVMDGIQKIIKQESFAGLFRGIKAKLVQSVLTAAFLFMSKEILFEYAVKLIALTTGGGATARKGLVARA
ncbi:mitochondrial carrier [Ramicandelaber brevisporus]|nr:mitochondrial carrier [Ramicandelaber brevisporus]